MERAPRECPRTLTHVLTHMRSANQSLGERDNEQVRHDIDIAIKLIEEMRADLAQRKVLEP